jgi:hypothetical protein
LFSGVPPGETMVSYLLLLIVPLACVPIQNLYLAFGHRYDLGSITYIATGTLLATVYTDPGSRPQIGFLIVLLLLLSTICFLVRAYILANGTPSEFTMFTFGQAWAVPALVQYEIDKQTAGGEMSVFVHMVHNSLIPVLLLSLSIAVLITVWFVFSRLPTRLITFTESPSQYRFLSQDPWRLAWRIETASIVTYLIAGVAFRFVINDVSGQTFGLESIWCLLSAAVVGRKWQRWVVFGPVLLIMGRLAASQYTNSKYSALLVYVLLAVCLTAMSLRAEKTSREITG